MQSTIPSALSSGDLVQLRIGQRSILLSFLLFFATIVLSQIIREFEFRGLMKPLGALVLLVTLLAIPALFIAGALRLTAGLRYGIAKRILVLLSLFLPPLGLLILLFMSRKATKMLRAAGYEIGLLGASARELP